MGNKSVIADPRRCVSCKSCMAACAAKHSVEGDVAVPRLKVVQVDCLRTAPVLCRHCNDAPCVTACPAKAVYQDEANSRVGVDMNLCVGCGSCVAACPYGAASVASRSQTFQLGGLFLAASPRAVVVKCDRCVGREEGPACVQACGLSALRIIERDERGSVVELCNEENGAASVDLPALQI